MATTYYKLNIKGYRGQAYASYSKGVLKVCVNEIEMDYESDTNKKEPMVPLYELDRDYSVFTFTELKPKSVSSKAALFVLMYKEHRNVVYTPTKVELANLKHVTVSEQLLKTYFAGRDYPLAGPKTITDYIRNYNAVRDLAVNGKPQRTNFPDVYDKGYEKSLGDNVGKLQKYWEHLRTLGWSRRDGVWMPALHTKEHDT